jgi:hypothetical protein
MKHFYILLSLIAAISFSSCEKYSDCILPVAGLYDAQIVGLTGPFTMGVSIDYNDNIDIDAQWLKNLWYVAHADTNGCADYYNENYETMKIHIHSQNMEDGKSISGEGFYYDYTLQIDYTITEGNNKYNYTLIGTKR